MRYIWLIIINEGAIAVKRDRPLLFHKLKLEYGGLDFIPSLEKGQLTE